MSMVNFHLHRGINNISQLSKTLYMFLLIF